MIGADRLMWYASWRLYLSSRTVPGRAGSRCMSSFEKVPCAKLFRSPKFWCLQIPVPGGLPTSLLIMASIVSRSPCHILSYIFEGHRHLHRLSKTSQGAPGQVLHDTQTCFNGTLQTQDSQDSIIVPYRGKLRAWLSSIEPTPFHAFHVNLVTAAAG